MDGRFHRDVGCRVHLVQPYQALGYRPAKGAAVHLHAEVVVMRCRFSTSQYCEVRFILLPRPIYSLHCGLELSRVSR